MGGEFGGDESEESGEGGDFEGNYSIEDNLERTHPEGTSQETQSWELDHFKCELLTDPETNKKYCSDGCEGVDHPITN